MKAFLAIVLLVLLSVWFAWFVERKDSLNATKKATTAVYAVQEAYLNLRAALNDALEDEQAYRAAREYDEVLHGVFTMMDVYSASRNLPDTYRKYGDRLPTHDIASPLPLFVAGASPEWERAPRDFFDQMRSTFTQPLDRLVPRKPSSYSQSKNSDVFWIPWYLKKSTHFQKHPDRPVIEARFKEIRTAFEGNTNGLKHINSVVSRRSEQELWRHLLDHVAGNMATAPFPGVLPNHLPLVGTEKWTAWDISQTNHYRCLSSFLPWNVQSDDPAGSTLFIVVYKRSSEYVGYYVPVGISYPPDRKPANSDAYVESAHVVVGRCNPFEVYGVRVLRSENPPETITSAGSGTGGYYAKVDDKELNELFAKIRGESRVESKGNR